MPLLKDRFLTKSGVSLLEIDQAAKKILHDGELPPHMKVEECIDVREYETLSGKKVVENCFEDIVEEPDLAHGESEFDEVVGIIEKAPRFNPKYIDRIEQELSFFDKTNNIKFLIRLDRMVKQFKEQNVVWGVGRGSSIASYVLYLLEVHDINPCVYGIPFYEMSKERD